MFRFDQQEELEASQREAAMLKQRLAEVQSDLELRLQEIQEVKDAREEDQAKIARLQVSRVSHQFV